MLLSLPLWPSSLDEDEDDGVLLLVELLDSAVRHSSLPAASDSLLRVVLELLLGVELELELLLQLSSLPESLSELSVMEPLLEEGLSEDQSLVVEEDEDDDAGVLEEEGVDGVVVVVVDSATRVCSCVVVAAG